MALQSRALFILLRLAILPDTTSTLRLGSSGMAALRGYWLMSALPARFVDIFSGGLDSQTSRTVDRPAVLRARFNAGLISYISGFWQSNDYTYTMNAATKAVDVLADARLHVD